MIVKGRSPNLRHVGRTHRVDLDWLFERIMKDPGIFVKYVGTKEQLAGILTKGFVYCRRLEHSVEPVPAIFP